MIFGKKVQVIDAPGFCDTDKLDTAAELDKYLLHCVDGIHVIALVLSAANRPTKEEIDVIKAIENKFGSDMLKFLMIIVTRADDLEDEGTGVEEFVQAYEGEAEDILKECCRLKNVIGFDNKDKTKRQAQAQDLLTKLESLVNGNQGSFYTRAMLEKEIKKARKLEEEHPRKIRVEEEAKMQREAEYEKAQKDLQESKASEEKLRENFDKTTKKMDEELKRHKEEAKVRQEEEGVRRRRDGEEMNELQSKLKDHKDDVDRMRQQNKERKELQEEINRQKEAAQRMQTDAADLRRQDEVERQRMEREIQVQNTQVQQFMEATKNLSQAHLRWMEEMQASHMRQFRETRNITAGTGRRSQQSDATASLTDFDMPLEPLGPESVGTSISGKQAVNDGRGRLADHAVQTMKTTEHGAFPTRPHNSAPGEFPSTWYISGPPHSSGPAMVPLGGEWYLVVVVKALGKKQSPGDQATEEAIIAEKLRELEATEQEINEMKDQRLKAEDELREAKKECEMLMDEIRRRNQMAKTRLRKERLGPVSEELSHRKAVLKRAGMRSSGWAT